MDPHRNGANGAGVGSEPPQYHWQARFDNSMPQQTERETVPGPNHHHRDDAEFDPYRDMRASGPLPAGLAVVQGGAMPTGFGPGPVISSAPPTVADKIKGGLQKATGYLLDKPEMVKKGEARRTGTLPTDNLNNFAAGNQHNQPSHPGHPDDISQACRTDHADRQQASDTGVGTASVVHGNRPVGGPGADLHSMRGDQPHSGAEAAVYSPGYTSGQHSAGYGAAGAKPTTGDKIKGGLQKTVGSLLDDPDLVRKGKAKQLPSRPGDSRSLMA